MGNLSAYSSVGSSPKAPLDPGTTAFVKGVPAISQPAEMTTEQLKAEARATLKHLDTLLPRLLELEDIFEKRWREFGTDAQPGLHVTRCWLVSLLARSKPIVK